MATCPRSLRPFFVFFLNFAIAVEWRRSTCFCRSVFTSQPKDVIVLGLGISERPGIASAYLEREAHDRDSIDLPEAQKDLAKKIIALGKPTIIFLLNGGGPAIFCFFCWWWGAHTDLRWETQVFHGFSSEQTSTLLGSNISPTKIYQAICEDDFPFPVWWDMSVPGGYWHMLLAVKPLFSVEH